MTGTRTANFTAPDARRYAALIPADAPDSEASRGAVLGPPDLSALELPEEMLIRLHNELHASRLFTEADFRDNPMEVQRAIQRAWRVDAQRLMAAAFPPPTPESTKHKIPDRLVSRTKK